MLRFCAASIPCGANHTAKHGVAILCPWIFYGGGGVEPDLYLGFESFWTFGGFISGYSGGQGGPQQVWTRVFALSGFWFWFWFFCIQLDYVITPLDTDRQIVNEKNFITYISSTPLPFPSPRWDAKLRDESGEMR